MSLISSNRATIISNAVQTATDVDSAKALATKLSWFDEIHLFFNTTIGDGSFAQYLQEKENLIFGIIEKSFEVKTTFGEKLSNIDADSPQFQRKMQDLAESFNNTTLPENKINQIKYCFGYNANDKNIVLRLKDGERQEEITILNLSQSQVSPQILDAIPKYWVGAPNEHAPTEYIESIKKNGVLSGDYAQFFTDANRQSLNGNDSKAVGEKIAQATDERPSFVPKDVQTTTEQNKMLNGYLSILGNVNSEFNDRQKNVFFMLFSQNIIPGRGDIWSRTKLIVAQGEDVVGTVTTNKNDEMVVALSCKVKLIDCEPIKGNLFFGDSMGTAEWKAEFIIDKYGRVNCVACAAPVLLTVSEENLTTAQTFAIHYLREMGTELAPCFKDNVLQQIHGTPNYQQIEAYAKQIEWGKSLGWEGNTPKLEDSCLFVH